MQLLKVMLVALAVTTASASFAQAPNQSGAAVVPPSATFVKVAPLPPAPTLPPAPAPTQSGGIIFSFTPIMQYDAENHLITRINARGVTRYEYANGKKTVAHLPSKIDIQYYYDKTGKIDHTLSSTGIVRTGIYDRATGKLAEIDGSNGTKMTFSTDSAGARHIVLTGPNALKVDFSAKAASIAQTRSVKFTPVGVVVATNDDGDAPYTSGDDGSDGDDYGGWGDDNGAVGGEGGGEGNGVPPDPPPVIMVRSPEWTKACYDAANNAHTEMKYAVCPIVARTRSALADCNRVNDALWQTTIDDCNAGRMPSYP